MLTDSQFNKEHLAAIKRNKKKLASLVSRIKKKLVKGYYEDVGSVERMEFKDFLNKHDTHPQQVSNWLGYFNQEIETL